MDITPKKPGESFALVMKKESTCDMQGEDSLVGDNKSERKSSDTQHMHDIVSVRVEPNNDHRKSSKFQSIIDQTVGTYGSHNVMFLTEKSAYVESDPDEVYDENWDISKMLAHHDFQLKKLITSDELQILEGKHCKDDLEQERRIKGFPSIIRGSRRETKWLLDVMDTLLEKAGIDEGYLDPRRRVEMDQIENLVSLIKKEQGIYNTIFCEVIDQVRIHCKERGQLLEEIRKRYVALLLRVPQQIMGLHAEVLAQRVLDRKLTSQFKQFSKAIEARMQDVQNMKKIETDITQSFINIKEDFLNTKWDTSKDVHIISEYHNFYEHQIQRFEEKVKNLQSECNAWQALAVTLAYRVASEHKMLSAERVLAATKEWETTASHVMSTAKYLSSSSIQEAAEMSFALETRLEEFYNKLRDGQKVLRESMKKIQEGLSNITNALIGRYMTEEYTFVSEVDSEIIKQLNDELSSWVDSVSGFSKRASFTTMVETEKEIDELSDLVENVKVSFADALNCVTESEETFHSLTQMTAQLNTRFAELLEKCKFYIKSDDIDNDVLSLTRSIESWSNHLSCLDLSAKGKQERVLNYKDSKDFYCSLKVWKVQISELLKNVMPSIEEEELVVLLKIQIQGIISAVRSHDASRVKDLEQRLQHFHSTAYRIYLEGMLHFTGSLNHNSKEHIEMHIDCVRSRGELSKAVRELTASNESLTATLVEYCQNGWKQKYSTSRHLVYENELQTVRKLEHLCSEWANSTSGMFNEINDHPPKLATPFSCITESPVPFFEYIGDAGNLQKKPVTFKLSDSQLNDEERIFLVEDPGNSQTEKEMPSLPSARGKREDFEGEKRADIVHIAVRHLKMAEDRADRAEEKVLSLEEELRSARAELQRLGCKPIMKRKDVKF